MSAFLNALAKEGTLEEVARELVKDINENKASGLHSSFTAPLASILEWKLNQWLRSQTINQPNSQSPSSSETPRPESQEH